MKCPRGTPKQIKANLDYFNSLQVPSCANHDTESNDERISEEDADAKEELPASFVELDVIRADERHPPTTEDEVTYLFLNFFLDILVKSWDGSPCLKPQLVKSTVHTVSEEGEEEEMTSPTHEKVSTNNLSADYLNEVYKMGIQQMSRVTSAEKEKFFMGERAAGISRKVCESSSQLSDSETYEETESSKSDMPWKTVTPDENVFINFQNGAWYKGRVSRRLMEGDGVFSWEDGGSYTGNFVSGTATGTGRLEFPDLCVYEGGVCKGFRHGEGLHCFYESPVMYSGEWWMGRKNGSGLIIYNDPSRSFNFYKGNWVNGKKEGFGYRQYASGSKYFGNWHNGKREGTGVMFWNNHDIYRGEWKNGLMDGPGEYIWNGFKNQTFSCPRTNTFRGFWVKGKKNGPGIFELSTGSLIETVWVDDEKHGPGAVVCNNGTTLFSKNMFKNNKQALINSDETDQTGLLFRNLELQTKKNSSKKFIELPGEKQLLSYMSSMEKAKAISITIHTPVHLLDLSMHLQRLQDQKKRFYLKQSEQLSAFSLKNTPRIETINGPKVSNSFDVHQSKELYSREEKLLRYAVMINLVKLKDKYNEWATVACTEVPPSECVLMRIFFWEMLIRSRVPRRNFSLVNIDNLLAEEDSFLISAPHNAFERIQFWQFIHFLITISWYLYGRHIYEEDVPPVVKDINWFLEAFYNQEEKAVLAVAFNFFLKNHVFLPENEEKDGQLFWNTDLVPMEGMYKLYKSIGEPLSARQLVRAVYAKEKDCVPSFAFRYLEKLPKYKQEGKNAILIFNELLYLPSDEPFNHPEMIVLEKETENGSEQSDLSCFAHIGSKGIVNCLLQVCPYIMEEDLIVDIEFQLTFLEFYKTVIAWAELSLQRKALKEIRSPIIINYERELEEYEKVPKETDVPKEQELPSRKTSLTKKAKK